MRVSLPVADLLRAPNGARERQLLLGAAFTVIDRHEGHAFGFANKDGYCGWLPDAALSRGPTPTHWVCTPGTHLYPEPKVQAPEICALSLGAELAITAHHGAWAETTQGFLPACHLMPLGQHLPDPVTVAESLLHTPYLWGGKSGLGIDCSGLVQLSMAMAGLNAPRDSDMQAAYTVWITPRVKSAEEIKSEEDLAESMRAGKQAQAQREQSWVDFVTEMRADPVKLLQLLPTAPGTASSRAKRSDTIRYNSSSPLNNPVGMAAPKRSMQLTQVASSRRK